MNVQQACHLVRVERMEGTREEPLAFENLGFTPSSDLIEGAKVASNCRGNESVCSPANSKTQKGDVT